MAYYARDGERPLTVEEMLELGQRHAHVESLRQLEPLMETMVADPVYEFHTLDLRLHGGANVRRYYEQFFVDYMSRITGGERIGEWASETAYVLESAIYVSTADGPGVQRVVSVLFAEGDRLGGERIYANERTVRMMAGMMFKDLEPLGSKSGAMRKEP